MAQWTCRCITVVLMNATSFCFAPATAGPPAAVSYPSLQRFFSRLAAGDRVTVAYLGGSITWGAAATDPLKTSYRARVTRYLRETYREAHVRAVDAAIGGTPSRLGVFRMDRDVLPYDPDLTFVEFAVNDNSAAATSQETMEGIVRKLHRANPDMAIVILILGSGWTYGSATAPSHRELAAYYGIPCIDVYSEIKSRVDSGDISTRDFLHDGTHPNDTGYRLYADVMTSYLERMRRQTGAATPFPETPLTKNRYESAAMIELAKLPEQGSWTVAQPALVGTWFDHQPSRWHDTAIRPRHDGASLSLDVTCTGVGLYYEITNGGGPLRLEADGKTVLELNSDMSFDYARVAYAFTFLDARRNRTVTLKAPQKDKTKAAYLLVTR